MIKYLDMFAGIGGFRSALDRVGGFECVACWLAIFRASLPKPFPLG